jgi:hypothetical protein
MNSHIKTLIFDTNNLIEGLLAVVHPDFKSITAVVKGADHGMRDLGEGVSHAYAEIIQELQYNDRLTQKMQHIIKVHELVEYDQKKSATDQPRSNVNLIRLNHLQFQVACMEYLSSIDRIQINLQTCRLHKRFPVFDSNVLFQYTGIMLKVAGKINNNFVTLASSCQHLDIGLMSKAEAIHKIYSMECERAVMLTYINKPTMTDDELDFLPKSSKNSEIELF